MEKNNFSIGKSLKFGLTTFKENTGIMLLIGLVSLLLMMVPEFLATFAFGAGIAALGWVFTVLNIIITAIVTLGLIKIGLKFCDGEKVSLSDIFSQYNLFLKYLVIMIIFILISIPIIVLLEIPGAPSVIGLILLLPLIYLMIKLMFFGYELVDNNAGPFASIKTSIILTKGLFWKLLLFVIITVGINFVGLLVLIVGLIATSPYTMVAMAHVYRQISGESESSQEDEEDFFAEEEEFEEEELEEFEEEEGEFGEEKE